MIPLVVFLLLALPAALHAESLPTPLVKTNPAYVSVCPDEGFADCHLTIVDSKLCTFLAELFDLSTENFHNSYNCDNPEEGLYLCVNVLGRRRLDGEVKTNFTYPYLLELAGDYERQLDLCLPSWTKTRSIDDNGQALAYHLAQRSIKLSILPFEKNAVSYDRLSLEIRDPIVRSLKPAAR